jgi:hypothetical protein
MLSLQLLQPSLCVHLPFLRRSLSKLTRTERLASRGDLMLMKESHQRQPGQIWRRSRCYWHWKAKQVITYQESPQILQQGRSALGESHLGEILQKWETSKSHQRGVILVKRHPQIVAWVQNFCQTQVKCGESSLFWHDKWNSQSLAITAPELYSFAKNKQITVCKTFHEGDFVDLFQLLLS